MQGSIVKAYANDTSAVRYTIDFGEEIRAHILNYRLRGLTWTAGSDVWVNLEIDGREKMICAPLPQDGTEVLFLFLEAMLSTPPFACFGLRSG